MGDRSVLRLGLCASPVFMRRCPGTLHLRLQPCPRAPGRIEFGEGRAEVPGLEPRRQKSPSSDCAHVRAVQRTEDHSPMPVCQSSCVLVQSRSASRLLCGRVGERRKRPDARWAGRGGNSSCPASLLHSLPFPPARLPNNSCRGGDACTAPVLHPPASLAPASLSLCFRFPPFRGLDGSALPGLSRAGLDVSHRTVVPRHTQGERLSRLSGYSAGMKGKPKYYRD